MAETKYGNLLKTLEYQKGRGGANAKELVFVGGEQLGGLELNFIVGVYDQTGDWAPGMGAHTHPFDELLLFFGYDDNELGYLGSEMELSLGKEWEKHKFNVPTVGIAPQGLPHCPLVTEKVYKAFGHFHLALSATYSGERAPQEGTTDGNKYSHLINPMPITQGVGGADAKQFVQIEGDQLEGLNINFMLGLFDTPGRWDPGHGAHVHPYDEIYVFFGHDTDNLSYFGAEITMDIGEEHEQHTFDKPTVVSIPRGLPHLPVVCNKVERPYSVMQVGLGLKYESTEVD